MKIIKNLSFLLSIVLIQCELFFFKGDPPEDCKLLTTIELSDCGSVNGLFIKDNYLYVACGSGVKIIDVSKPQNPLEVKVSFINYGFGGNGIFVKGNYAYVAAGPQGVVIIDINDPSNPSVITTFGTDDFGNGNDSRPVNGVFVDENQRAYILVGRLGVGVIDVTDPKNPSVVSIIGIDKIKNEDPTFTLRKGIFVKRNYVYVAVGEKGLAIIDLSKDQNNVSYYYNEKLAQIFGEQIQDVYVEGDYAYVIGTTNIFEKLYIGDAPNNPSSVSYYHIEGASGQGIYVKNNYVYIAAGAKGVVIMDKKDIDSGPIGQCNVIQDAIDLFVDERDFIYVISGSGGGGQRVMIFSLGE